MFVVGVVQLLKPVIQLSSPAHRSATTNLALMTVTVVALGLSARFVDRRPFADYGLRWEPGPLLLGSLVGLVLVGAIVGIASAMGWVRITRTYYSRFSTPVFPVLLLGQVGRCYFGSVFEESFSRGVLLKNVAEGLGFTRWSDATRTWVAYGTSAILFGLQHAGNPGVTPLALVNLAALGLLFGSGRLWTGSLSFGIGMHAAWNLAAFNILGSTDDVREVSVLLLSTERHWPWSGSAYGIEGSAIASMVIATAFALLVGIGVARGRQPEPSLAAYDGHDRRHR